MILSEIGIITDQCWQNIPNHFSDAQLDESIVMPNHVHGIITIDDTDSVINCNISNPVEYVKNPPVVQNPTNVGVQNFEPLRRQRYEPRRECIEPKINKFQHIIPRSLGSIIRGFKIGATKWSRKNNYIYDVWQRSFYDHIIRNEFDLNRIRRYIRDNPRKWDLDRNNSENLLCDSKFNLSRPLRNNPHRRGSHSHRKVARPITL